jgi:hypothetical protein
MNFFEEVDRRTAEQAWADFCQLGDCGKSGSRVSSERGVSRYN